MRGTTIMRLLVASALSSLAIGCQPSRYMLWPTLVHDQTQYFYFVEQEEQRDSRIKKCDIHDNNTVTCTLQFDLDNPQAGPEPGAPVAPAPAPAPAPAVTVMPEPVVETPPPSATPPPAGEGNLGVVGESCRSDSDCRSGLICRADTCTNP